MVKILQVWIMMWSIVGSSMAANNGEVKIKPPQCINYLKCNPGQDYEVMTYLHEGYTGQEVQNQKLLKTQLLAAVTAINNARAEMITNGTSAVWTAFYKKNYALFTGPTMDYTKLYPILVANGYKGSEAYIIQWYTKFTQAQRIATMNSIITYGMAQYMANIASLVSQWAAHYGEDGRWHPPSLLECQYVQDIEYSAMFVAAGAALIGLEAPAAGLGFIGAAAALGGYLWGC